MPGFLFPGRPGDDEPLLDIIFDGRSLPPRAPQEMHDLARMLAAAAGPVEDPSELAGEAAALAAFTRSASPARVSSRARTPTGHRRRRRRWPRGHWSRGRARLATALLALVAVLSGAAIYTGALQQVAHIIVAPASDGAHKSSTVTPSPRARHKDNRVTPPAPSPSGDHSQGKKAAGSAPSKPPVHRSRAVGCTPWPIQTPGPWYSPMPSSTGQPQFKPCPNRVTPVPTPTHQATAMPTMPDTPRTGSTAQAGPAAGMQG